ncbi:MAG TPA: TetR family transcriptional regulator [Solirubrobacteraceae bacterium]|nr:TetR family transcriptional regulator [Solirubrobacteraceae bacterium]
MSATTHKSTNARPEGWSSRRVVVTNGSASNGNVPERSAPSRSGSGVRKVKAAPVAYVPRTRIIAAIAELVAERGYDSTTASLVVSRARVSRRTFYEQFTSVEDCFLNAVDDAIIRLASVAADEYHQAGNWAERVRAALVALLGFLESEPAVAFLLFVEAPRLGPVTLRRCAHTLDALRAVLEDGRDEALEGRAPCRLTAEALVAGAIGVIQARLSGSSRVRLMTLVNPLMSVITLPYLGGAAAAKELQRSTPSPRARPREANESLPEPRDPFEGLQIRVTYRTMRVLSAIAEMPGACSKEIADAADVSDNGQISKIMRRLEQNGLVKSSTARARYEPHEWRLTPRGERLAEAVLADLAPA